MSVRNYGQTTTVTRWHHLCPCHLCPLPARCTHWCGAQRTHPMHTQHWCCNMGTAEGCVPNHPLPTQAQSSDGFPTAAQLGVPQGCAGLSLCCISLLLAGNQLQKITAFSVPWHPLGTASSTASLPTRGCTTYTWQHSSESCSAPSWVCLEPDCFLQAALERARSPSMQRHAPGSLQPHL